MNRFVSSVAKGAIIGAAVGTAACMAKSKMEKSHTVKRSVAKAMRSVSNKMEDIASMIR